MTREIDQSMTSLRRNILGMGAAVEQRVAHALKSIFDRDPDLARSVRKGDSEVDVMELDIDEECLRILALHSPVAGDLRHILATLRINTDLERIADLAKTIGKRVIDLSALPPIALPDQMRSMADAAQNMLADVMSALANHDPERAESVRHADAKVDDDNRAVLAWAVAALPQDEPTARATVDVLTIARAIERIGDQCTNIAEEIIFAVNGEVVRHARLDTDRTTT